MPTTARVTRETHDLDVCVDCLVAIANGDLPDDPETRTAVTVGIARWHADGYQLAAGDHDTAFSRAGCDVCLSLMAGSRHGAVAIGPRVLVAHCVECDRRFNLSDSADADEWATGHDCEC